MNAPIVSVVVLLVFAVGLRLLAKLLRDRRAASLPYAARPALLTPAEQNLYAALRMAAGNDFAIFAKVRLADLIDVQRGLPTRDYYQAFNRIAAKHIDFILCEPATSKLLCAIELDDASHKRPDRQLRDRFVNDALNVAGLPLLRIRAQRSYRVEELRQQLRSISTTSAAAPVSPRARHRLREA